MMLVTITAHVAMASSTIVLHCQVGLVNVFSDRLLHFLYVLYKFYQYIGE